MTFDIEQEKRELAEMRLEDAIEQYQAAKSSEDCEALEDRLDEIKILQGFQNERPKVEKLKWDSIPEIEREWLIKDWLPANTATMFTGDGGAGKSWLTLQAVCQVALGYQNHVFLQPEPGTLQMKNRQPVIFATWEDEPAEIKRRLHSLASTFKWIKENIDAIKENLHIVDMRGIGSVWGPGLGKHINNTGDLLLAGEDLRAICEVDSARLLVMDPLSGAFGNSENDRTAVYDFVSSFRGWGEKAQCAVLVIGHLPKGAEGRASGFSGSTAWEASARSMWMIQKQKVDEKDAGCKHYWRLLHTKSNYAALQPPILLNKDKNGWWTQAKDLEDAIEGFTRYQNEIKHNSMEDNQDDEPEQIRFAV